MKNPSFTFVFVLGGPPFLTRIVSKGSLLMILVCVQKIVSRSRGSLFPVDVQLWYFFKDDQRRNCLHFKISEHIVHSISCDLSETFHISSNEQCKSSQQHVLYVLRELLNVSCCSFPWTGEKQFSMSPRVSRQKNLCVPAKQEFTRHFRLFTNVIFLENLICQNLICSASKKPSVLLLTFWKHWTQEALMNRNRRNYQKLNNRNAHL